MDKLKININNLLLNNCKLYITDLHKQCSYSHKIYIEDDKNKKKYVFFYYVKLTNYDILQKIFLIMSDKILYDKVMKNPKYIEQINIKNDYYYPSDYPFPNVNFIFYNNNQKSIWIDRINKLYFSNKKNNKINSEWYDFD